MARNDLTIQPYGDEYATVEDHRWRTTTTGMTDGQNANLIVDATLKADGPHREFAWVKGGVPVFKGDDKNVYLFDDAAEADGKKIFGFLYVPYRIMDYRGGYYDTIPVAVQTRGEIIYDYLPVHPSREAISERFGITDL